MTKLQRSLKQSHIFAVLLIVEFQLPLRNMSSKRLPKFQRRSALLSKRGLVGHQFSSARRIRKRCFKPAQVVLC